MVLTRKERSMGQIAILKARIRELETEVEELKKSKELEVIRRAKTWDQILSKHTFNFIGILPYKNISAAVEEYCSQFKDL